MKFMSLLSLIIYFLIGDFKFVLLSHPETLTAVELNLKKESTEHVDFTKDDKTNTSTFTAKKGYCFNKVFQKKSGSNCGGSEKLLYEAKTDSEYSTKVVQVYNKSSKTKTVTAYFVRSSKEIEAELVDASYKFDLNLPSGTKTFDYKLPALKNTKTYELPETSSKFTRVIKSLSSTDWTVDTDHQKEQEDLIKKFVSEKETELKTELENNRKAKETELRAELEKVQKDLDASRAELEKRGTEKKSELKARAKKLKLGKAELEREFYSEFIKESAELETKVAELKSEFERKRKNNDALIEDYKREAMFLLNNELNNKSKQKMKDLKDYMANENDKRKEELEGKVKKLIKELESEKKKLNDFKAEIDTKKQACEDTTDLESEVVRLEASVENMIQNKNDLESELRNFLNSEPVKKSVRNEVLLDNINQERLKLESDISRLVGSIHTELNSFKDDPNLMKKLEELELEKAHLLAKFEAKRETIKTVDSSIKTKLVEEIKTLEAEQTVELVNLEKAATDLAEKVLLQASSTPESTVDGGDQDKDQKPETDSDGSTPSTQ